MSNNSSSIYFSRVKKIIDSIDHSLLDRIIRQIKSAYRKQATIFFIGNGGSAGTASHLAADLGKNTVRDLGDPSELRFRTLSLTDNIAWITALGNDIGYSEIFTEQLKNLARKKDLLFIISGSGNSPNLVSAAQWARKNSLVTIGLLGFDGGKLKSLLDFPLIVDSSDYCFIEGVHSEIAHFLVEELKNFKRNENK